MLGTTILVAASLPAWEDKRGLYRSLARACAATAVACLGVGAARPTPLVLSLALVLLLSIPWGLAVARRLASGADSPGTPRPRGCPSATSTLLTMGERAVAVDRDNGAVIPFRLASGDAWSSLL